MINASPDHLFERLLQGPHGLRSRDWYEAVAGAAYADLYGAVREALSTADLPPSVADLRPQDRRRLSASLRSGWPGDTGDRYRRLTALVSEATAARWASHLGERGSAEGMLWRLLRMGSAPYFILGADGSEVLRLRVATPWDWRQRFVLRSFGCTAQSGGQPRVGWSAVIEDRHSRSPSHVDGHVEIRWSHGRFGGNPEAKLYLDTPHPLVPGYHPLDADGGPSRSLPAAENAPAPDHADPSTPPDLWTSVGSCGQHP
jgi:hypothetical protein